MKLALALIAALLGAMPSLACVCEIESVAHARRHAVAVFQGTVVQIDELPLRGGLRSRRAVHFRLSRAWTGISDPNVTVYEGRVGSDCDFGEFRQGQEYVVFARPNV